MKDKIYDAIIIGAGPAGASLAYFLSDFNLKIALIERKKYADTPVRCAELVPKAITMLYSDKIKGINNEVSHMETYIEGRLANVISSGGYILDRNIFVDFLIKEFEKKGGYYLSSTSFTGAAYPGADENASECQMIKNSTINKGSKSYDFNKTPQLCVKIRQKDKITCLRTKILAGADGPYSQVARIMKSLPQNQYELQENHDKKNCFLEGIKENHDSNSSFLAGFKENTDNKSSFLAGFQENIIKKNTYENHTKIFFYPFIAGGYGWLFPKKNSLNVGIAVNMDILKEKGLKNTYLRFKNELVKNAIIKGDEYINSAVSGLVPVYGIKSQTVKNNIVLIGDAAGLCNPITGAGNYNAALSAKIAAEKIKTAIQSQNMEVLKEAEKEISVYFKTSLDHALKKRQVLEKNNYCYDYENLIKKTWVSFKDYWRER
jgi:flavin-dependent dehydrogenase